MKTPLKIGNRSHIFDKLRQPLSSSQVTPYYKRLNLKFLFDRPSGVAKTSKRDTSAQRNTDAQRPSLKTSKNYCLFASKVEAEKQDPGA